MPIVPVKPSGFSVVDDGAARAIELSLAAFDLAVAQARAQIVAAHAAVQAQDCALLHPVILDVAACAGPSPRRRPAVTPKPKPKR